MEALKGRTLQKLKVASVVVIVCSVDKFSSIQRVETFWLAFLKENQIEVMLFALLIISSLFNLLNVFVSVLLFQLLTNVISWTKESMLNVFAEISRKTYLLTIHYSAQRRK